jgi:hypothetical protein
MRLAMVILIALPAFAQQGDWSVLNRIRPETRLNLFLHDGKSFNGRFVSSSPTTLAIDTGKTTRVVDRGSVRQVSIREKQSRWRGAMIGSLVGFGIGFAIGGSNAGYLTDRNNPGAGTRAAMGSGLGMYAAAIGAPIGALTGGSKLSSVYLAEKRR